MKKTSYSLLSSLMPILLSVLMLATLATGCSKSSGGDDASSLLRTVPADASSVVLVNIAHSVERLGGSTDGSAVELPPELVKAIDESEALRPDTKLRIKDICAGQSGIAMTSVAFFSAARSYVTGLLNDPDKFIAYMEKSLEKTAQKEGDATTIGNVAVLGNQFWACTTGRPDVDQLKYYQQLNDKQSYVSAEAAELLLQPDKVVSFVADVNRSLVLIPNGTYMKMASSMVFEDMAYVAGAADMVKSNVKGYASVLNSEMKPAEMLLPVEKIDPSVVKSFDKGGNIFIAAGIPKKLIKKLTDAASAFINNGSNPIVNGLQAIDGTVAVRANAGPTAGEARIQTTGKNFSDLSYLLQNVPGVRVTRDGDTLTAVYDTTDFTGYITPDQAADRLKGAWIGVVSNGFFARNVTTVAKLSVEKKSLRLDFEADGGVETLIEILTK